MSRVHQTMVNTRYTTPNAVVLRDLVMQPLHCTPHVISGARGSAAPVVGHGLVHPSRLPTHTHIGVHHTMAHPHMHRSPNPHQCVIYHKWWCGAHTWSLAQAFLQIIAYSTHTPHPISCATVIDRLHNKMARRKGAHAASTGVTNIRV